jgi:glycosyltransferase involved in cell wall biosynthesis
MSSLFLLGVGPLPFYAGRFISGLGIGTWQLAKPLLGDGHQLTVVCFEPEEEGRQKPDEASLTSRYPNLRLVTLAPLNSENRSAVIEQVNALYEQTNPDAVITAGTPIAAEAAMELPPLKPLWVDLNGAIMPELQAKAATMYDPQLCTTVYRLYLRLLRRGDHFSTVSNAQRHMVIGELGVAGRLNRHNFGHDLVSVVPNGIDTDSPPEHTHQVIREVLCGDEEFVILSSGGYNNWMDVDTLFAGVDRAMAEDPAIHYVSTGGGIPGHYEEGYERFSTFVEGSPHRERYHLLGWLPYQEAVNCYFEANVGINIDRNVYESEFGARNRFLSWMQAALPILTTLASEISWQLVSRDLVHGVPVGDPETLAKAILALARDREGARRRGERAQEYAVEHLTFEKTTVPLRQWVQNPRMAPDHLDPQARADRLEVLLDEFAARLYQVRQPEKNTGIRDRFKRFLRQVDNG